MGGTGRAGRRLAPWLMITLTTLGGGVVMSACAAADVRVSSSKTAAAGVAVPATPAPRVVASTMAAVHLVASGLNQPKKISLAPDGSLIVAVSGDGAASGSCTNGSQASCLDRSGAIDRITASGRVSTLLGALPSVSSGSTAGVASGPAEARIVGGRLQVLFQDVAINASTGRQPYGSAGALLGDLARFPGAGGSPQIQASFGPFEAAHKPNHEAGTDVARHVEPGVNSDPYAYVPYHGGYAVADAGGDDLLFVSRAGKISVLAVFPTIREMAPPGIFGSSQTKSISAMTQPVPDSVAVGPDGALYVGELGGEPYGIGKSSVYRVVPGQPATVYARGFTSIGDIAFDSSGRLLVLEIDQKGLNDPALKASRQPAPGAIIRVGKGGTQSMVASTGLEFATAMAVARGGTVYVSNHGIDSAGGGSNGGGGQIVRLRLR
jgi:hypothetical protein